MTSAYILIVAILVLGGLIAALGDRLGTKVGKARLRLFKLRPKQTAMVVTVITGTTIAALTLGILFSLSESLRQGVFDLDDIQRKRRAIQAELEKVTAEKALVEAELEKTKARQTQVQNRLSLTNQDFQEAQDQLKTTSSQAEALQSDISLLLDERQQLRQQRNQLKQQTEELQKQVQQQDQELAQLKSEVAAQAQVLAQREERLEQLETQQARLQTQIARRDDRITQLDQAISAKDNELQAKETRLGDLESQLEYLRQEITVLDQYYQTYKDLRARQIALVRGQVLAFATVRINDPDAAVPVIDRLLREANRAAIKAVSTEETLLEQRVVKITEAQVEQLRDKIQDGRDYVVRILSAGNYVQEEQEVRIFADVAPNQEVFKAQETIATISIDPDMTSEEIQQRLDLLLSASKFRARSAGVLGEIQIEDGSLTNLVSFIEKLNQYEGSLGELKAVASEKTRTAGPLKLRLVATRNGEVVFST